MAYQKRNVDGKVGLCHQRAGAGPDGYDMRRSFVTLIPGTELGYEDRAADSKCPVLLNYRRRILRRIL